MSLIFTLTVVLTFSSCSDKEEVLRNSQVYYDSLKALEENNKVIIFLLDGFGYSQYNYALEMGKIPFISSLGEVKIAEAYLPSISNVGLAALITGKSPEENGVKARGDLRLKINDIFYEADKLNKSSILIEGDVKLLDTSVEPLLNPDTNNNAYTDDEVYNSALESINDFDLIFVHFHGIDDASHTFGPKSNEAMDRLFIIDGYIDEILKSWKGSVIISADHGQHENSDSVGEHGTDTEEDIKVPYLYIENIEV